MNEDRLKENFEELESMASKVKQQVSDAAGDARESLAEGISRTTGKIDQQRQNAARGLVRVASVLHEKANDLPLGNKAARVAHATANRFEDAAEYIREHPVGAMVRDLEDFVRRYPGQSIAVAVFAGFLIGRAFRSEEAY